MVPVALVAPYTAPMADRKTREEVLAHIAEGRGAIERILDRLPSHRLTEPGLGGGDWSPKDLMAHLGHWEAALIHNLGGPPTAVAPQGSESATNAAVHSLNRDRPLEDVLAEFAAVHRDLVARVGRLTDEELNSLPYPGATDLVWQHIAAETWGHYPMHLAELEAFADPG